MAAARRADVVWEKDLTRGSGMVKVESGALPEFQVSWGSRTGVSGGKTSPEELLAAAQSSCYAMALAATLERKGKPPQKLEVSAECTFDSTALKVTTMAIGVKGYVKDISNDQFKTFAQEAEKICPVANAIRNNVKITLTADLAAT